jgi:hypothetical protein
MDIEMACQFGSCLKFISGDAELIRGLSLWIEGFKLHGSLFSFSQCLGTKLKVQEDRVYVYKFSVVILRFLEDWICALQFVFHNVQAKEINFGRIGLCPGFGS